MQNYKVCPQCGNAASLATGRCVRCDYPFGPVGESDLICVPAGSHSPVLAAVLSVLIVFGGQFYNRQFLKGIAIALLAMVCAAPTAGLSALITWPVAVVDAALIAQRLNRGEAIRQWQFF